MPRFGISDGFKSSRCCALGGMQRQDREAFLLSTLAAAANLVNLAAPELSRLQLS
jgi:hypothetical protein